ncbi:cytochrome P460 family protein [Bradyrhizobium sp. LjRoot220]|uniref:cytochrome P460 family protein n=1 Tax=Bradyrhizobium sp. LjRoot220 TaxID=3342284 RepID=UPI003ECE4EE6
MKLIAATVLAAAAAASVLITSSPDSGRAEVGDASPIFGVHIPTGYRQWELIAPAQEAEPLNELRAVLGNAVAIKAYRDQILPFPDGTILAKLAWKHIQSPDFEPASIPGAATTVQIMVKDSKKYPATGGWGFGRFIDGKPADEAQHKTCFACHEARLKARDYVFTRYAR